MRKAIQKTLRVSAASALVIGGLLAGSGAAQAAPIAPAPEVVGVTQTEYFNTSGACNSRWYELTNLGAHCQPCYFGNAVGRWVLTYNMT
ncbi:hypothetical protein [Psychromicrobium lacuslunae]|uniref:Secreted protein n=1 Tax=Psychromicrobium lacuslunae TaxID=1618207 RepID=A0A0D4BYZ0_9MICC|nr:hypothetical protein [Psychromicrobium lacuslunae]AJT41514.1 hypothetical protein UM93_08285 [Psychromicrobium lacuslunae]